jgi:hypothetical protein
MADLYTNGMSLNLKDNFIVPPYSKGRRNNIDPLGPNNQGGRFSGMPPDEYLIKPMHLVEAYMGKQLTGL